MLLQATSSVNAACQRYLLEGAAPTHLHVGFAKQLGVHCQLTVECHGPFSSIYVYNLFMN